MIRYIAPCLLLATMAAACHKPEDYLLGPSQVDRVLSVTVSAPTMPADGISQVTVTGQIDPRTDADKRNVSFTTTDGTLIGGGQQGSSVVVQADSTGKAVVALRSSMTPSVARVEASVGAISGTTTVRFLMLARVEAFDATVSSTSIPADGFSKTVIAVTLRRLGTVLQRAVTFETSLGTFIAPGQANSKAVTVTADSTGRAAVELQSEKSIGDARVRVTALEIPDEFTVTFTPVNPAQIITLSAAPSSGPADGVTPLIISATVAAGLPAGRRSVTFRSTLGQVIPVIIEADSSNIARASLVSTTTGVARISATVDGTTADATAQFTTSVPNSLHVSLGSVELKSGGSTQILTTLLRATGIVSPHLRVSYSAKTGTGAAIGSFSGVTLAENSIATATFNVGTTTFLGPVTITASAEGGAIGTARLQVVP